MGHFSANFSSLRWKLQGIPCHILNDWNFSSYPPEVHWLPHCFSLFNSFDPIGLPCSLVTPVLVLFTQPSMHILDFPLFAPYFCSVLSHTHLKVPIKFISGAFCRSHLNWFPTLAGWKWRKPPWNVSMRDGRKFLRKCPHFLLSCALLICFLKCCTFATVYGVDSLQNSDQKQRSMFTVRGNPCFPAQCFCITPHMRSSRFYVPTRGWCTLILTSNNN